ncbi:hypothetical protein KEM55_003657, partial [Ascosphaera atra]
MAELPVFTATKLFGGAMSVAIPEGMADISDYRQVPDHQEVFAHSVYPISIIVELVERVVPEDAGRAVDPAHEDLQSAVLHLEEICRLGCDTYKILEEVHGVKVDHFNDAPCYAGEAVLKSVSRPPQGAATTQGVRAALGNKERLIRFLLIRLREQTTDVLITITHEGEAVAESQELRRQSAIYLGAIQRSISLHDWGLF